MIRFNSSMNAPSICLVWKNFFECIIIQTFRVVVLNDGKIDLSENTLELWFLEYLFKKLSHMAWRIGECSTTKSAKN